jgi:putative phage-type endonuclease
MYFEDLDDLNDVLDEVEPSDEDNEDYILDEESRVELTESILYIMENYITDHPTAIIDPDFDEIFTEYVKTMVHVQLCEIQDQMIDETENKKEKEEQLSEEINDIIEEAMEYFYDFFMPERSFPKTFLFCEVTEEEKEKITKQLDYLREKPQPAQRTPEWYTFRHNLITASNAYKAFENDSIKNQLIYEKCQPLIVNDTKTFVNTKSPFHWGQKYEPVSVMLYEEKYKVRVGDFGCIQHDKYKFLGASPDGINIDPNSKTYGRMLEIKNIVNREIDGVPKKEYWVQMQLQMETCNLNECDFLETRFIEYQDTEDSCAWDKFEKDGSFSRTGEDERKGVILYFAKSDGNPFYKYMPLHIVTKEMFEKWEDEMMDLYQSDEHNMTWIKNIYWYLEEFSCVLVLRNQKWFQDNIETLEKVWSIILKERASGFQHRAPCKRVKKQSDKSIVSEGGCLLNMNKESGKISIHTEVPKMMETNTSTSNLTLETNKIIYPQQKMEHFFFKIRTESFDEAKQIN